MEKEIKIDYVAKECNEYKGTLQRGIKVGDTWYNVTGTNEESINEMFTEDTFSKGNTVIVAVDEMNTTQVTGFVKLVEKSKESDRDIHGLEELLDKAHKSGLIGIETQLISHDPEKKQAVFKASVVMNVSPVLQGDNRPKIFQGHGDADQINTGENIREHYIRMAETRAICRALRWATNNAEVSAEEIGEKGQKVEETGEGSPEPTQAPPEPKKKRGRPPIKKPEFADSHTGPGQKSLIDKSMEKEEGKTTEVREYE